jgi:hypothetical protein
LSRVCALLFFFELLERNSPRCLFNEAYIKARIAVLGRSSWRSLVRAIRDSLQLEMIVQLEPIPLP